MNILIIGPKIKKKKKKNRTKKKHKFKSKVATMLTIPSMGQWENASVITRSRAAFCLQEPNAGLGTTSTYRK